MTAPTAMRLPARGWRSDRSRARKPSTVSRATSEYIRVSVSYRMANGEEASSSSAIQPRGRPPSRLPASQIRGRVITPNSAESDRTATSDVPKALIQKWSR